MRILWCGRVLDSVRATAVSKRSSHRRPHAIGVRHPRMVAARGRCVPRATTQQHAEYSKAQVRAAFAKAVCPAFSLNLGHAHAGVLPQLAVAAIEFDARTSRKSSILWNALFFWPNFALRVGFDRDEVDSCSAHSSIR